LQNVSKIDYNQAMQTLTIQLFNRQQARAALQEQLYPFLAAVLQADQRYTLEVRPETRSGEQNRVQWPILQEFARQIEWPINGHMVKIDADDWKAVLSAAFKRETVRLAMGLDGGVVMLGQRTSKFTKAEFSEWIEFLYATAMARGVKLPAWERDQ
jgi:hypothetical protein